MSKSRSLISGDKFTEKLYTLDTFVISSTLTVVGIRTFLEITGYPQIGGDSLHIAHMLWGGLAMLVVMLYLLLIDRPNKLLAALVGGVGFGFFVDEIGKFVTNDNNYFFEGTAFLIYMLTMLTWFGGRLMLVRMHDGSFFTPADWPKERLSRTLILGYVALSVVSGLVTTFSYVFSLDANVLAIDGGLAKILPFMIAGATISYIVGLRYYWGNKLQESASVIRNTLLFTALTISPFVFFVEQFSSMVTLAIQITTFIALSESSVKGMMGPYFTKEFWSLRGRF